MSDAQTQRRWLKATDTKNFLLNDPLLDWLELVGHERGYLSDYERENYDPRMDFGAFIVDKGTAFEEALIRVLRDSIHIVDFEPSPQASILELTAQTKALLKKKPEAVYQACVAHTDSMTFGYPDLLVRSDVLAQWFTDLLSTQDAAYDAPLLDLKGVHYRVVDIKFTTLSLTKNGDLQDTGSASAYKGQVYIYNQALAELQGYWPKQAFVLGRGWVNPQKVRSNNALDRAAIVATDPEGDGKATARRTTAALTWLNELRTHGRTWTLVPRPSVPELYPNMTHTEDAPWHKAKQLIAAELQELTQLWQVGVRRREKAHRQGIFQVSDVQHPQDVAITNPHQARTFEAILAINKEKNATPIQPARIKAAVEQWGRTPQLEFYVDFETVSDLDDSFSTLPKRGGSPMIFMIGCGYVYAGVWSFKQFIATELTTSCEAEIIDAWWRHMDEVRQAKAASKSTPIIHWSAAEKLSLETAYNSATNRHNIQRWINPPWFDFLKNVIRAEPVVVRGALGFGLKTFAKAMHNHGMIQTSWEDGPADGLGAMVGAWNAAQDARKRGISFDSHPLVLEIARYNQIDTRVMWEIVSWLRAHHVDTTGI